MQMCSKLRLKSQSYCLFICVHSLCRPTLAKYVCINLLVVIVLVVLVVLVVVLVNFTSLSNSYSLICFCGHFQKSYSASSSKFENVNPLQQAKYMSRKKTHNNSNVQSHVLDGGVCCLARLSFPFLCKPLIPDQGEREGKNDAT